MAKNNVVELAGRETIADPLTELLRAGATMGWSSRKVLSWRLSNTMESIFPFMVHMTPE